MALLSVKAKGDYSKAKGFLGDIRTAVRNRKLEKYGQMGVDALAAATPKDTGLTASSWIYRIEQDEKGAKIVWTNTNRNKGVLVAVILQYGHGTGTGGYVAGQDYINPALKPVFDKIANDAWEEVRRR